MDGRRGHVALQPFKISELKTILASVHTRMGAWRKRKDENEIDLVCEDEFANRLDFVEIKRDLRRIDLAALRVKREVFYAKHPRCGRGRAPAAAFP